MTAHRLRSALSVGILATLLGAGLAAGGPLTGPAQAASDSASAIAQDARGRSGPSPGGTWEWWNDEEVRSEIGLTPDKARSIDEAYRRRSREMRPVIEEFVRESNALDAMTKAASVDEAVYNLKVIQVETLLSKIRESRTMMLYRFYRELTPDQYRKLQDAFVRRASRGGRGRGPGE